MKPHDETSHHEGEAAPDQLAASAAAVRGRLASDVAALKAKTKPRQLMAEAGRTAVSRAQVLTSTMRRRAGAMIETTRRQATARPAPIVMGAVAVGAAALAGLWLTGRARRRRLLLR